MSNNVVSKFELISLIHFRYSFTSHITHNAPRNKNYIAILKWLPNDRRLKFDAAQLLMENNAYTLTVENKHPEIERVNDELRNFANKQRARKFANDNSFLVRHLSPRPVNQPQCTSIKKTLNNSQISRSSTQDKRSRMDDSARSSRYSSDISSTIYRKKKYEDWKLYKLRKERKKQKFLQKYLKTHPYVSQYKRDYILKYGKPTFMLNAQKYLSRQNFAITEA